MIKITIPGREKSLNIENLLLDLNGTLTIDGHLPPGVKEKIDRLKRQLKIYLLTADTYGTGARIAEELNIEIFKVSGEHGGADKKQFLLGLNPDTTAAIGNGYNDVLMLESSVLSIVIIGKEGCCVQALLTSDIAVTNINDALELLLNPKWIMATLRN